MKRITPVVVTAAFLAAAMLFLAACGTSPSARYYSLDSVTPANTPAPKLQQKEIIIVSLGPVGIPEYLDRQEIVTRDSRNKLNLSDFDLWGSSLENDVNRVLVDNLSALLGSKGIGVVTWRARVPFSHTISVSMSRFEAVGDSVVLTARWGIMERGGDTMEAIRESVITKPLTGKDYAAIVGSMSDALADLSKEIAVVVEEVTAKQKSVDK